MVERAHHLLHRRLQVGEVDHHAQRVERARPHPHADPVAVAVQVLAAAAVAADLVRRGEAEVLADREAHAASAAGCGRSRNSTVGGRPSASVRGCQPSSVRARVSSKAQWRARLAQLPRLDRRPAAEEPHQRRGDGERRAREPRRQLAARRRDAGGGADRVGELAHRRHVAGEQVVAPRRGACSITRTMPSTRSWRKTQLALRSAPTRAGKRPLARFLSMTLAPPRLPGRAVDEAGIDGVEPQPLRGVGGDRLLPGVLGGAVGAGKRLLQRRLLGRQAAVGRAAAEVGDRGDREEARHPQLPRRARRRSRCLRRWPPPSAVGRGGVELGGGVDHPVGARHPLAHRGAVAQVADEGGDAQPRGARRCGWWPAPGPAARAPPPPAGAAERGADVARGAGQEDAHGQDLSPTEAGRRDGR